MAPTTGHPEHLPTLHPDTIAVAAGRGPCAPGDPINEPLSLSTVTVGGGEAPPGYARDGTPTWAALEQAVGALEGGSATAYASGIAAIAAVLDEVPVGGTVVAPHDAYSGLRALLAQSEAQGRLAVRRVDIADTDAVTAVLDGADLLWVESPTNPLLAVADLPALCAAAADRAVPTAVDATFTSPLRQQPLAAGADVVVHSATKLISGHSDALLGLTVAPADSPRAERLRAYRTRHGAVPGSLEAFLALRGLRTLSLRLDRAEANAGELARRLAAHPLIRRVRYPGLPGDPGADRAQRLLSGPGTIVSVELADANAADALCANVELCVHATSLGGVETTLERRARQGGEEHVPPALVRMSVGCEDVEDLWADLDGALARR